MDFTLHDAITTAFNENEQGWDKGSVRLYENFVNDFLYPDIDNILVFAGNHDTNRINGNGLYDGDLAKYKLAMSLVLTTRGIPQLYYGDEIGMGGNKETDGDGDIRQDFPGGWDGDVDNAFKATIAEEVNAERSRSKKAGRNQVQENYHSFTKKLLNYRKDKQVLHNGKLLQYVPEQNCYVYFRTNEDSKVMVILNNNPEEITLDFNRFSEGIGGRTKGTDIISDVAIDLTGQLKVAGKMSLVIDLD
jgi:glycosidase